MQRKQLETLLVSVIDAMKWSGRIELDYDRYAGYEIVRVRDNGAHTSLTGRMSNNEMSTFMQGILYGCNDARKDH